MITLPFEGIPPLQVIHVSLAGSNTASGSESAPLRTIQEAVNRATPGTTIMVEAGTYVETVKFNVSGLPGAPISLISVDGPGAAKIVPNADTTRKATIAAFGEENIVISGFDVSGGGRLENGIQFGMNGTDFTDMTANIVIKDNIVHDTVRDGIKVSHGDYVYIVDNTVSHAGDQGIDFVAVNNSVIARNDVSYITGSAPALFVKAGSTNILIAQNHVSHAASDGITVGGWTGGSTWMRPGFTEWQAKNVLVIDNHVEDCGKRPLNILGGQDSQIIHNWLESNPDYYYVVTIAPDDSTPSLNSKNILLKDNAFDRGDHWLQVLPGQDVGLQVAGNRFDNIFQGATGPHSGDLDYDLAWLPNDGDHLLGTAGADTLNGGAGADTMAGGLGNDTYSVDTVGDVVIDADNAGTDTVRSWISYTLGSNLENLTLVGSANINATGNALNNALTGNGGNNVLNGGAGADTMAGGLGNDTYSVDAVGDVVTEADNAGTDTVRSWISYTLGSNLENLTLVGSANISATGNALNNVLTGNGGNNVLNGGAGADTMAGGLGNDTVFGGSGDDQIDVSVGNDTVRYTSALDGSDVINGFDGNPTGGQDVLNLDALFDSLGIAAATRADHLSIDTHATSVDVRFDADGNDANGFELTIATLNTADAITVGSDVIVGT